MKAITLAMMVYCFAFAVLIFALGIYRWLKRSRESQAFANSGALGSRHDAGLGSTANVESSSQGAPPIKAA
jgi:uncharacterized iron-regulated membrane protein